MSDADTAKVIAELRDNPNLEESVLVSTCLRTEVYAVVDRFHDAVSDVKQIFATRAGFTFEQVEEYTSVRFDDEVPEHVFSVAAGLKSAVVGESEVLGQIRRSCELSQQEKACGPVLSNLFRHAVETGKRVRSETGIARGTTSFSNAAVEVARDRLGGTLSGSKVLVVGAGAMGFGVSRALLDQPVDAAPKEIVVANRSRERVAQLADLLSNSSTGGEGGEGGEGNEGNEGNEETSARPSMRVTNIDRVSHELGDADVVFTAVDSDRLVITKEMLCDTTTAEGGRILAIDLGVPRNIDPSLRGVEGVTLLDMDDLGAAVNEAMSGREEEAVRAREIVVEEVSRYRSLMRERGATPTVTSFRARLEQIRKTELDRQRRRLSNFSDADWEKIDALTRSILAKVLHEPTVQLKDAAGTARGERLVEALRTLFDL